MSVEIIRLYLSPSFTGVLSDSIIWYSLCLESAACGRGSRCALPGSGSVIHHFGGVL